MTSTITKWIAKRDWTLGAIYRFGISRQLSAAEISHLLIHRVGMTDRSAKQLVAHWLSSEPYRTRQEAA